VEVSARGLLSAAPAALAVANGRFEEIRAWAGPWPLEERWWDGGGRRRARIQVVLAGGDAHMVCREGGAWWVEASYG
jgi:protein ImuB